MYISETNKKLNYKKHSLDSNRRIRDSIQTGIPDYEMK